MRVVVFSTDRSILNEGSPAFKRQEAYAKHFDSYSVVVLRGGGWKKISTTSSADVISSQDPFETGLFAYVHTLLFRKPLHVQVHTDFFAPAFTRGHFLNSIRGFIAPFVLRRAHRIRVVSESIKESIEKQINPKAPITVLPIFVDMARFQNIPRVKHPRFKIALLAVSRLEKEKNISLTLDALKAARDKGHDAGLTIVGSGSEEGTLKEKARSLGIERFVAFVGTGNPLEHYAQADAVLVPSLYEGYGMVIIEALAAGIPVIATDVGIAREAGAIVTTEKEFAHTLIRWIESGPRQASLTQYPYANFDEYVKKYCEDIKATSTIA